MAQPLLHKTLTVFYTMEIMLRLYVKIGEEKLVLGCLKTQKLSMNYSDARHRLSSINMIADGDT